MCVCVCKYIYIYTFYILKLGVLSKSWANLKSISSAAIDPALVMFHIILTPSLSWIKLVKPLLVNYISDRTTPISSQKKTSIFPLVVGFNPFPPSFGVETKQNIWNYHLVKQKFPVSGPLPCCRCPGVFLCSPGINLQDLKPRVRKSGSFQIRLSYKWHRIQNPGNVWWEKMIICFRNIAYHRKLVWSLYNFNDLLRNMTFFKMEGWPSKKTSQIYRWYWVQLEYVFTPYIKSKTNWKWS